MAAHPGLCRRGSCGRYFSGWLDEVAKLGDYEKLMAAKDIAWRGTFWVSLLPGILFVLGSLLVPESSRWLFSARPPERRPRFAIAAHFCRGRSGIAGNAGDGRGRIVAVRAARSQGVALHRKYVVPFLLACIILACNQATGINSVIGYNTTIYIQAGLSNVEAHNANLVF